MTHPPDSTKPPAPHHYGCGDDYDTCPHAGTLGYDFMEDARAASLRPRLPPDDAYVDRLAKIQLRVLGPPPRKPSIRTLVKQAEKATGKTVTSITTPDGTTLHFGEPEPTDATNPWLADFHKVKQQ